MSSEGQVKFKDEIKYFEYDDTGDICIPKLYDSYDELCENKTEWDEKYPICNHDEETIEIYANYGGGFYWKGTACRKCNMILKGIEPLELPLEESSKNGIPDWVEDFSQYYDEED